ncbi:MAG: multidrug transporter [Lentisphaerae bacterium RIFOXYB12_FULL_65_16]|nr:MAG: multidrug transporter [Lentisphaerae bacterium RIFOXYA12_64_32]OGV92990.1 MAG: multidrug transporter [Lentisphaerae bacterium RIFOXYB12_FULL_65_16]
MTNRPVALILIAVLAVLNGCSLAPKYVRPQAPVPTAWPASATDAERPTAADAPQAQDLDWRQLLADERLQQVVDTALTNNRDLRLAALNVERARALYGVQRAELLPTFNAVGTGSRQRMPADVSGSGKRETTERFDANLGLASWEIDFFGRVRSLSDRALAEYLATEQARRGAQLLVIASVANAYLSLAADRENLALVEATLQAQTATSDLVQRQFEVGVATQLDVCRARTQVEAARRDIARYTQMVAQDVNALDLLAGTPVPRELLPADLASVTPPADVAPGLPSEVLLRRPDVLQAESRLKAANANIGAARAALFPRVALTSSVGTASSELSGLFASGSGAWTYAPQVVMPIFDLRTWSALKVVKVQRELAVTEYERAIQAAFRDVADALAVRSTVDQQVAAQQALVNTLEEAYRLANTRYTKGLDSYLGVLDAHRSLYIGQQILINLRLARLANRVTLYKVLSAG